MDVKFNSITVKYNEPFPHQAFEGIGPISGLPVTDRMKAMGVVGLVFLGQRSSITLADGAKLDAPAGVGWWLCGRLD